MRVLGSCRPESAEIPAEMIDRIGDHSAMNTFLHQPQHSTRKSEYTYAYLSVPGSSIFVLLPFSPAGLEASHGCEYFRARSRRFQRVDDVAILPSRILPTHCSVAPVP